eukprot:scaffold50583_cov34-Prasinocladus_malaysianus.AAC.1
MPVGPAFAGWTPLGDEGWKVGLPVGDTSGSSGGVVPSSESRLSSARKDTTIVSKPVNCLLDVV